MTDSEVTSVIFKRETGGSVLAVFPREPGTGPHDVTVYARLGQHSTAAVAYVRDLKPAAPADYADLKRELERIGYRLQIRKRMTAADSRARREACQ